jgi:ABC-type oligopeptide transport system substrate-binding subunit
MKRWLAALALLASPAQADGPGLAMHGEPKYPADFAHFEYVEPDAPKGGALNLAQVGTFDSLNPFLVRGVPAAGIRLTFTSLLQRSPDEPFSLYPFVAERVETPEDRSWVEFALRPGAKWRDGSEVTVEDVVFSLETLRDHGRPNHRFYYSKVREIERRGPRTLRLHFEPGGDRELPLIMGLMPLVQKREFARRPWDRTTLEPLQGTGPYAVESVEPGRSIAYRRIPGHWSEATAAGRGQHNFDLIRYDYYRDEEAAFLAFQSGAADLREETDPQRWALNYDFPAVARGDVVKREIAHRRPSGMNAFVFNARRPIFSDRRVRFALMHALDFEWMNRTFFHDAYRRTTSYFDNSELAAKGLPSTGELALLVPLRKSLPPELFERAYAPPGGEGLRRGLRDAQNLLAEAGWRVRDGRLVDAGGAPFRFEIMLVRREHERPALAYARALERIGIEASVRLVDSAQYQERLASWDYDMIVFLWEESLSPGNEQAFYWGSAAADAEGSRNYPGIRDPAVDALIERIVAARTRSGLIDAVRALDRTLLWGHWVVPLWHLPVDRVAHWDRFGFPPKPPLYGFRIETWWAK